MPLCTICGEDADIVTKCRECGARFCIFCGDHDDKICDFCYDENNVDDDDDEDWK